MLRPRAIFFDIGDTLIHFAGLDWPDLFRQGARAAHAYLLDQGVQLPRVDDFVDSLLWRGRKTLLLNRLSRREIDVADMFVAAVGPLHARLAEPVWREFMLRLYEPLATAGRLDPQTVPVVRRLRDAGLQVGLISNTFVPGYAIDLHLEQLGVLDLFQPRFYSAQVGLKKPSLSLFRQVVQSVGVPANRIWHVGNDLIADVLGARRAGVISVLRLHPGERVRWWWLIKPQRVIHELTDLLRLLRLRD
jgi:FMN phosphatase YigB (HAD superfamily)